MTAQYGIPVYMEASGPSTGRQSGASTVEFLIVALVAVPLFLIMPLIGKYIDLAQTTEMASRYVAFQGTIHNSTTGWESDADLAAEVRRRFFSTSDAPVKTNDVAGNYAGFRNPLWVDHQAKPLLDDFDTDVAVSTSKNGKNAPAAALFSGGSGFSLSQDNFYTGQVVVRPANVALLPPFDSLNLVFARADTILVDGWTAPSPSYVKSKVENAGVLIYPIQPLELLGATFGALPPLVLDPAMDVNDVNPDIVPSDRLK